MCIRDRSGTRAGRSVERPDDDLLERHEVVRAAERRRAVPPDAARSRPRGLDGRAAGLRSYRGRRCGLRGGVPGQRDWTACARAVVEAGGDRLGYEGAGVRLSLIHISEPTRLLSISYAVF